LGPDKIGKAIAEAVANSNVNSYDVEIPSTNNESSSNNGDNWVRRLQEECNKQGFSNQTVDGIPGPNTLKGCPIMRQGARGNITKLLQEKLINLGYNLGQYGADGVFGAATYNAVVKFQKANGLTPDGIVGQNTWRKLLNL
ncbi:MAG: peptidoglycan-binding domain-containing protein, partial [Clostridium saudiense]|nr:peptidoglycan-binding domain-containing protein [Clostridium saudiense]